MQAPGVPGAAPAEIEPPHGYTITKTLPGSANPVELVFAQKAFDIIMAFFDKHVKHAHTTTSGRRGGSHGTP